MGKKFGLLLLCFILIFGVFLPQGKGVAAGDTITIAADTVNVRKGPGLSYELVKQVNKGEKFTILTENEDWIEIELSAVKSGWVANWLVTKTSDDTSTVSSGTKTATAEATENQLRVRSGPGTSFRIVGYLNKGQAVTVLDTNENWLKIASTFGEGWVSREYLELLDSSDTSEEDNDINLSGKGLVTASLNVREEPSTSSPVVGKLSTGTSVTVYSKQGNWVEIKFSNQRAWVSAEYIQMNGQNETQETDENRPIGTVTATTLSVRDHSSLNSAVIGAVKMGQRFTILEEENNWVKIEYEPGQIGWAAGWYFTKDQQAPEQVSDESTITILHNGTNIRKTPNVQSDVLLRANEGEKYSIKSVENDWYKITLSNGESGYVAGWLISTNGSAPEIDKQGADRYLKNKTIVIDPGHGGIDSGATGAGGSLEKELTLRTALLLYDKLRAAGANVF
jgi:N-acetylmuramoyl-L-alanine amidase